MLSKSFFQKINVLTIGSVLVLILVGSIVRSFGAGMGCPDWPKCFGTYIPPTSDSQLPDDYQTIYLNKRIIKNERLASILNKLGFEKAALKITNDPRILIEEKFSVSKAWIEYINRLVGVLIGLFVFANMVYSFSYVKESKLVPILGVIVFLLTGVQGWVGSIVVSTNLLSGMIAFHMIVALLILALLILMFDKTVSSIKINDSKLLFLCLVLFLLLIPQIIVGTGIRGEVDAFIDLGYAKSSWLNRFSNYFFIHRSASWAFLVGSIALVIYVKKKSYLVVRKLSISFLTLVLFAMLLGFMMSVFDFPAYAQPLHLLNASLLFGISFYLILQVRKS